MFGDTTKTASDLDDDPGSVARWVLLLTALAASFVLLAVGLSQIIERDSRIHTIVIPPGTADRLAAGEDIELIPANLRFTLSDRLVIENNDDQLHQVGPFSVGPGERIDQEFREVATIEGMCSLHPSGSVTIEIESG